MLFSSNVFLFAFLPVVLTLYFAARRSELRNLLLLTASLLFYAWGEMGYTLLLLLSIAFNFAFGAWIGRWRGHPGRHRVLAAAVIGNLALLGFFKYANFVVDNLAPLLTALGLPVLHLPPIHLPIGISFFTFQALTYVIDVYRGDAEAQASPLRVGLYIALFPQLIAGPIVRYRSVAAQLAKRHANAEEIAEGIRRFIIGLGKKVLIANTLAVPADAIFALPGEELSLTVAWLGAVCFGLQIYFDFAGYSDMAIGLGRIFGFHFPENFAAPYSAQSLREFWRRWHISLSTWFRDYLYIPLGGNRLGRTRTSVNLFAVFLLCGLWHGASWNFVVWGLLHGGFLALERTGFGALEARMPRPFRHLYTLLVVLAAWVIFRCETLSEALAFLGAMAGAGAPASVAYPPILYLDNGVLLALAVATSASTRAFEAMVVRAERGTPPPAFGAARVALHGSVLLACAMALAAGSHDPFIYFRF